MSRQHSKDIRKPLNLNDQISLMREITRRAERLAKIIDKLPAELRDQLPIDALHAAEDLLVEAHDFREAGNA